MYQQQVIELNQIKINFLEWNNSSSKEVILMLHGMADNSLVWQKLGNYLASKNTKYHIIAPDLRGHGNSSKPKSGYFYQDYFADLESLYEHFKWDKIHLISHSWSGKIACLWATKFPEKVNSLVLIDPFFINSMPPIFKLSFPFLYKVLPFLKLLQSFPDYDSAKKVAQRLKQYQGWTKWQEEIFDYSIEKKENGSWSSKFTISARNEIFEDVMLQKGLSKLLDIPSLLILPEQGLNRSAWQINPYKKYLTNLNIAKVPGNHWAFIVEPEAFNPVIAEFLVTN